MSEAAREINLVPEFLDGPAAVQAYAGQQDAARSREISSVIIDFTHDIVGPFPSARKQDCEQGIVLVKLKGVVQQSLYDADCARIRHQHALGVPLATIVDVHLKYGKYRSLKSYLAKLPRQPSRNASAYTVELEVFPYLFNNTLWGLPV